MRAVSISEKSLCAPGTDTGLTFRRKLEIARLLDGLGLDAIEAGIFKGDRQDCLLIKTLAGAVTQSTLSIGVDISCTESITAIWDALKCAAHPRLQIPVPVSVVQMEYLCHKKPSDILEIIKSTVGYCSRLCPDTEFVARDFSRSDRSFLLECISAAIEAGASTVTLSDQAGNLLPEEFIDVIRGIREHPGFSARLGVECSNEMFMADACAMAAVIAGADEIKTSATGNSIASLKRFATILNAKGDKYGVSCGIRMTDLLRTMERIKFLSEEKKTKSVGALAGIQSAAGEDLEFSASESRQSIAKAVSGMGYSLSDDDLDKVYDHFRKTAARNGSVQLRELESIVASEAFQAPQTYRLESYVVNSSNLISATCHLKLIKGDEGSVLESVCCGDGPVDSAFHAIEHLVDRKYELDDFQIKSVTEGREALGEAVVRLRASGKVFSGRGTSTDIVGASIQACISAVNKIVYEEDSL